jgi:flagellar basal-body rod modification protein FlgD
MAISSILNTSSGGNDPSFAATNSINDIDLDMFLKLMITELQNQDPLNPLDNKDMLAQISQIREVGASDKLTKTLESVLLGQNIASATNLIGADVSALTDAGERVSGVVNRISIDKGSPKLHIDNRPALVPSSGDGNMEAGTYNYRVVWEADGKLLGMEFSGDEAITTTGADGVDRAVQIQGLPVTDGAKFVYRTDASGRGSYHLVGVISDGTRGSFVDGMADEELSGTLLTQSFQPVAITKRSFDVPLNNVSAIRPPSL